MTDTSHYKLYDMRLKDLHGIGYEEGYDHAHALKSFLCNRFSGLRLDHVKLRICPENGDWNVKVKCVDDYAMRGAGDESVSRYYIIELDLSEGRL